MSTLQVGTIKSASSAPPVFQNSSGTEKGKLVKKYVNFNGSSMSIREDFGVSSITDNGTGHYQVNFDGSMSNDDYAVVGSSGETGNLGGNNPERIMRFSNAATGTVQARCRTSTGGAADDAYVGVIIIGTN